jgi:molybdate transport system ATP-binding protein
MFISHSLQEMRLMTDDVLVFDRGRLSGRLSSEALARQNLAAGEGGYINLLTLKDPVPRNNVFQYQWGAGRLTVAEPGQPGDNLFELSSREITLFKRHPEASSARNLLDGTVTDIFSVGNRVGVEFSCNGERLVSQIVPESVDELGLCRGVPIVAAIKASAFRKLF